MLDLAPLSIKRRTFEKDESAKKTQTDTLTP